MATQQVVLASFCNDQITVTGTIDTATGAVSQVTIRNVGFETVTCTVTNSHNASFSATAFPGDTATFPVSSTNISSWTVVCNS